MKKRPFKLCGLTFTDTFIEYEGVSAVNYISKRYNKIKEIFCSDPNYLNEKLHRLFSRRKHLNFYVYMQPIFEHVKETKCVTLVFDECAGGC